MPKAEVVSTTLKRGSLLTEELGSWVGVVAATMFIGAKVVAKVSNKVAK